MQKYCLGDTEGFYHHCEFRLYDIKLALHLFVYLTVHKSYVQ